MNAGRQVNSHLTINPLNPYERYELTGMSETQLAKMRLKRRRRNAARELTDTERRRESMKKDRCIYCGIKIYRDRDMCENCREKLKLIRKIRGIIFDIKRRA